jgi:hypothetical protein
MANAFSSDYQLYRVHAVLAEWGKKKHKIKNLARMPTGVSEGTATLCHLKKI